MAGSAEIVSEFRGIVDGVIANQVAQCKRDRRTWLGFDTTVRAAELDFVSVDMPSGLSAVFERCEGHLWGVGERDTVRFGNRLGSFAVMSFQEDTEYLYRKIAINSPIQLISRSATLKLEDEQMEAALRWIQSPHIAGDALRTKAGLIDAEKDIIRAQLDEDTRQREAQDQALRSMRSHRLPGTIG